MLNETDKEFRERILYTNKIRAIMDFLEIPCNTNFSVLTTDLYDILMDEEKFKKLATKLKLKAFW
jgi:hypothetical protein